MELPTSLDWKPVATTIGLVAVPWTWLLLPRFGGLGEMIAIAAPLLFFGVLVVHVVSFFIFKRVLVIVSALVWLISAAVMIESPRTPTHFASPRNPVTIVAANLHYTNKTPVEGARDVVARHADVVVISEGTPDTESVLAKSYPYELRSGRHGNRYGEFVVSRYPLRRRAVPHELNQAVVAEVMAPAPFLLVGVHLPRAGIKGVPYLGARVTFAGQQPPVSAVVRLTKSTRLPVVVAGDLNVSDRTASYRRLVAHRRDAMRAGWARSTYLQFPWRLIGLRIDHVLIDNSWCAKDARRFHPSGSDHDGVEVVIGPCP
jgi:endonuclease/exonuclease/phosphatase (EEP) superfamily protein YafD